MMISATHSRVAAGLALCACASLAFSSSIVLRCWRMDLNSHSPSRVIISTIMPVVRAVIGARARITFVPGSSGRQHM